MSFYLRLIIKFIKVLNIVEILVKYSAMILKKYKVYIYIKQMQDLYEILSTLLIQFELNLARIYVLNPKTKEDAFNKSILWIKEHLEFMELVYGHIKAQEKKG
ncbi:hypothetical protein BLD35_02800 [Campylobacter coli]|nr:hypothetical protein BLD35_02800 [Campylobacter coli]